jgi:hypothetical protein
MVTGDCIAVDHHIQCEVVQMWWSRCGGQDVVVQM